MSGESGATRLAGSSAPKYAMLNDVYNRRILELAANIPRLGRLQAPDATETSFEIQADTPLPQADHVY